MEATTPALLKPPPPLPAPSQSFDLSPLEFILALFAVIIIPTMIYTFFLFIKCPPNPFRQDGRSSGIVAGELSDRTSKNESEDDIKYRKEVHVKEIGLECPVCLSVFADGEEIRRLTTCKHSFHASCVDTWLNSRSNCPVCRTPVPGKRPVGTTAAAGEDDLRQGLPDSASLV